MTKIPARISKRLVSNLIQIGATKMPRALGHSDPQRLFTGMLPDHARARAKKAGKGLSVGAEQ